MACVPSCQLEALPRWTRSQLIRLDTAGFRVGRLLFRTGCGAVVGRVLVTGMSGAGKSTALVELASQGYWVIDTDDDVWIEDVPLGDGTGSEPQWREDRMATLLEEHAGARCSSAAASRTRGGSTLSSRLWCC